VTALNELWNDDTEGAFLWASPAGRPLYEGVGFVAVTERRVWVLGGTMPPASLSARCAERSSDAGLAVAP
jgi:hypothetical protein